jgi:hypothetical protein
LNERTWGKEGTTGSGSAEDDTDIDLDLAYVSLKEFLYSPLTLVLGRQELRYGNALIIGDIDTNSTATSDSNLPSSLRDLSLRKSFDAAKAVLNYDPLVIDLVYSKIEQNSTTAKSDVDLWGVNLNYAVNKELTVEGYWWDRNRKWGSTGLNTAPGHPERLHTIGARGVYGGIENLTLGLEAAYQFGDHITSTTLYPDDARTVGKKSIVSAYALQFTSNYKIPKLKKYEPQVGFNYTRLSGDKDYDENSRHYTGWSPMYEDQAQGTIFNRIIGYSNAQLFNLSGKIKPVDDVNVSLDWYHIRILQTFNTAATNTRKLSGIYTDTAQKVKAGKRHLADEVDLNVTYDYTEDVQFGLNAAAYIPGSVYDKDNKKTAKQFIGSMKVTF